MKKVIILSYLFFTLFFPAISFAEEVLPLNAYFFNGEGCPHCAKESLFLESIKNEYPNLRVHSFEIYYNKENAEKFQKAGKILGVEVGGVPFLVIGNEYFIGFSEQTTPKEITARIEECQKVTCVDSIAEIAGVSVEKKALKTNTGTKETDQAVEKISMTEVGEKETVLPDKKTFDLPFLGEIDPLHFSLPIITIVLGTLDGFNPCAMWTLLFLISLLLGMNDKKRMWILGGAFILASSFVYFLFMSAWLNVILFVGFVSWLKILIGGIALLGGGYNIKCFFADKNGGCKVGGNEKQLVFDKLKIIVKKNNFWLALIGIILLAFAVNLVELVCSAGLPAIYTQILALNQLSFWQYYFYIGLYILFFMLDDLFVFFVSMSTLQMTGITTKYSRFSKLIGGILMIVIGLLLFFKPEWLMFG